MHTKSILFFSILMLLGSISCYGNTNINSAEVNAVRSFKHLGNGLFVLTFQGDYGFADFLKQGGAKTDVETAKYMAQFLSKNAIDVPYGKEVQFDAGCSTIQDKNLYCRSFDFGDKGQNMLVIRTFPTNAYASISTTALSFLGFGETWIPRSKIEKLTALEGIYMPFDGMNEKGLCVADLIELDGDTTDYDTPKPDLTIVGAIRLLLDYAATTNEAIELLKKYDIHKSIGWHHHLSIADSIRSVVVEWKEGEIHVTDADIVTNHCRWEKRENPLTTESKARLARLTKLDSPNTPELALQTLQAAAYTKWTIWSIIFNRNTLSGTWFIRRDWENPLNISINNKDNE